MAQTLGDRIRIARHLRGLTQRELSSRLGLTERTGFSQVSRWENEHREPGALIVAKMVEVLQIDGHWLLTGHGVPDLRDEEARGVLETIRRMVR